MNAVKRFWKMELSQREMKMGKRILASILMPILIFQMTSMNLLTLNLMRANAADGSGTMTVDDRKVTAGGSAQNFKFTFDPSEDMNGGAIKIEFPSPFPKPILGSGDGQVVVTAKNSAVLGTATVGGTADRFLTIPFTTMSASDYLVVTYNVTSLMPTVVGDYEFTAESSLNGTSFDDLSDSRQASVEIEAGAVSYYDITKTNGAEALDDQTVGVAFDVKVTAYDINHNITPLGSPSVVITADGGTGVLSGETTADTSGDGMDTLTLKYSKPATNLTLIPAGVIADKSNEFDVANLTIDSTLNAPGSSTNDPTPLINWDSVDGTDVTYQMQLVKKSGTCNFDSPLLTKSTSGTSEYQLTALEALNDQETYCVKVIATDGYTPANSVTGNYEFNLLTSKPATPTKAHIATVGNASNSGHPANVINIYNNEDATVKVEWDGNLNGGKAFVKIKDGLDHYTSEVSANISGSDTRSVDVSGIDASSLQQGTTLDIYARVEDAGTNSSDWKNTTTSAGADAWVIKDTSSPAQPSAVSFVDNPVNIANQTTVDFNVTGEIGASAQYTISSSGGGSASDASGNFNMTSEITNSGNKNLTGLNDGTLTASVYLVDSAWNHSSARTATVTKDAAAPDVALTYNPNHAVKDADTMNVTATFTEGMKDAGSAPTIAIDYADVGCADLGAAAMSKTSATIWTYGVDVPTCAATTTATITINGQDLAGNANDPATNNTFTVDNQKPTVSGTVAEDPADAGIVNVSLTFNENMDQTIAPTVAISTFGNAQTLTVTGAYSDATTWTGTATVELGNANGVATLKVSAGGDVAGNIMDANDAVDTFMIDTAGPTFVINDGVAGAPVKTDVIKITVSDATGTVASRSYGFSSDDICNESDTIETPFIDATNFDIVGDHTDYLCAKATDNAGNVSYQLVGQLSTDNTVPVFSDVSPTTDAKINNVTNASDIGYTLSENIASGTVVFTRTGGSVDEVIHTCDLVGTAKNSGTHLLNISDETNGCVAAQSLVEGAIYTITFNGTDVATNAAVQVSRTGVVFDSSAPTGTVTLDTPMIFEGDLVQVATVTYNEAMNPASTPTIAFGETTGAVTSEGAGVWSGGNTIWTQTFNIADANEERAGVSVTSSSATDVAGNPEGASTAGSFNIDTLAPTVAITSAPTINNANEATYTVSGTCSENTRAVAVNIGGVVSNPICTGLAWTTTSNVSGVADNAALAITADHSDAAGNNATQATASVVKDTANPTVTIDAPAVINNANKASYTLTGTCSEDGRVVSVVVGGLDAVTPSCGAGLTWTTGAIDVSEAVDSATLAITADHMDAAGNNAQATASVVKDTLAPTVTITDDEGGTANIAGGNITYTFTFSQDVTGFAIGDITVAGGTKGVFTAIDAAVYTLVVTPDSNSTTNITVDVAAAVAIDANSNGNTVATQSVQAVDTLAPTVTITDDKAGTVNIAGGVITYTFTFSEAVTGFAVDEVIVTGGTKAGAFATGADGDSVYTLVITPATDSTTNITVDVAAGVAIDANSNGNTIATQSVQTVDTLAPTVTITDDEGGTANIAGGTILYTFTFSQAVTGFTVGEVNVVGGTKADAFATGTDGSTVYTLVVTPNSNSTADITVDVAADVAIDANSNGNTVAIQSVQTVDTLAPTVTITDDEAGTANIAGGDITYTFTFSQDVTGFAIGDISVAGGTTGVFTATNAAVYTLVVTPNSNSTADITVDVAAGVAIDANSNGNTIAIQSVQTVDTLAPTVANVTSSNDNGYYNSGEEILVNVTFDSAVDVTGAPYITLETGTTDRNASLAVSSGSGTTTLNFSYVVQDTDTSADLDYFGTGSLTLNGGTIKDASGNDAVLTLASPGTAGSLGFNKQIVIDTTAPAAPIVTTPTGAVTVNADNYSITGTAEANALVQVFDDGEHVLGAHQLVDNATAYSISVVLDQNVVNNFIVTATDLAGNEGADGFVPAITEDSIAPAVNAGADRGNVAGLFNQGDASATDASGMTYAWTKVDGPGDVTFGAATDLKPNVSASLDGNYEVRLTVTDAASNSASDTFTFTWDTTAPTETSVSINSGNTYATSDSVTLTFVATDNWTPIQMMISNAAAFDAGGEAWESFSASKSWTLTAGGDGTKTVYAKFKDAGGNTSGVVNDTIVLDVTDPAAPASLVSTPASWSETNSFNLTWSNPDDTSTITGVWYKIGDAPTGNTDGTYVAGADIETTTVSAPVEGQYTVYVWLQDGSGRINKDNRSTVDIRFDTTAPNAPTVTSATHVVADNYYNNNDPELDWAGLTDTSGILGYSFSLDQTANTIPDSNLEPAGTSTSYTDKADGTWYFHIKAQNGSGLWSATTHRTIKIDTSTPSSSVTSDDYDRVGTINVRIATLVANPSGIKDVDLYARYDANRDGDYIDTNEFGWTNQNLTPTANAVAGEFTFNPLDLDGQYQFYSRVQNNAGTWEAEPVGDVADDSTIFDRTNPGDPTGFAVTSGAPYDTWTTQTATTISWTAATDVTSGLRGFSYKWDNSATADLPDNMTPNDGSVWVEDETIVTNSKTAMTDGLWYFHIQPRDVAGNYGATTNYGPFKIDTTDPNISHSTVSSAVAGENIRVSADVTDAGSNVKEAKVYYKHSGDASFTEKTMNCDGSWHCTYDIPDEENASRVVKYYIQVLDNAGNDSFDGTASSPHSIDIIPASLDHFTFIRPSGDKLAGQYFAIAIEARDEFNNTAVQFDGGTHQVAFTTVQAGIGVFVKGTSANVSGSFDDGTWIGEIALGTGSVAPTNDNIEVIATYAPSSISGNFVINTSGTNFGTVAGSVAGVNDGAETGTGGESVTSGEAPAVQGAEDGALVPNEGKQADNVVAPWWKRFLPWMEIALGLAFVGWAIPWWIRRRGGGAGGSNLTGILFSTLKTAGQKIRMFLW